MVFSRENSFFSILKKTFQFFRIFLGQISNFGLLRKLQPLIQSPPLWVWVLYGGVYPLQLDNFCLCSRTSLGVPRDLEAAPAGCAPSTVHRQFNRRIIILSRVPHGFLLGFLGFPWVFVGSFMRSREAPPLWYLLQCLDFFGAFPFLYIAAKLAYFAPIIPFWELCPQNSLFLCIRKFSFFTVRSLFAGLFYRKMSEKLPRSSYPRPLAYCFCMVLVWFDLGAGHSKNA